MSEDVPECVRVVDLKHYLYCPRIIYFDRVLGAAERVSSQQMSSLKEHARLEELEKRRKGGLSYSRNFAEGSKKFRVRLFSERLNLEGVLDCLLICGKEVMPVDYKQMRSLRGGPWLDHKIQLTAYALLLEDAYNTVVRRGYIYYLPEELVVEVIFSEEMKNYVASLVKRVERILKEEELPPVKVDQSKCLGCGYYWVCRRA